MGWVAYSPAPVAGIGYIGGCCRAGERDRQSGYESVPMLRERLLVWAESTAKPTSCSMPGHSTILPISQFPKGISPAGFGGLLHTLAGNANQLPGFVYLGDGQDR